MQIFLVAVAVDVVTFVAANVAVGLVVRFHVVCVNTDIAVVLPDVSGFLLEAADVLFDVVGVLVFVFIVLFEVFGALLYAAGFLVAVGGGVSADGAGVLVVPVGQFVEVFAAVLSPSH